MHGTVTNPETEEIRGEWLNTPKSKRGIGCSMFELQERRADSRVMSKLINQQPSHQEKKTGNTTQQTMSRDEKLHHHHHQHIPSNTIILKRGLERLLGGMKYDIFICWFKFFFFTWQLQNTPYGQLSFGWMENFGVAVKMCHQRLTDREGPQGMRIWGG